MPLRTSIILQEQNNLADDDDNNDLDVVNTDTSEVINSVEDYDEDDDDEVGEEDKDDAAAYDLTVEIAEDVNSVEDLVRFPPPVVFRLRNDRDQTIWKLYWWRLNGT